MPCEQCEQLWVISNQSGCAGNVQEQRQSVYFAFVLPMPPAVPVQSQLTVAERLSKLKLLLTRLPPHHKADCPYDKPHEYNFCNFLTDKEKENDLRPVGAFNEAMKAIFGWKTRTTGDGFIHICPWGPPITSIVDVLQNWTTKFFRDAVVEKWLDDVIVGVELVYTLNDIKVSVRFQFQSTTDRDIDSKPSWSSFSPNS